MVFFFLLFDTYIQEYFVFLLIFIFTLHCCLLLLLLLLFFNTYRRNNPSSLCLPMSLNIFFVVVQKFTSINVYWILALHSLDHSKYTRAQNPLWGRRSSFQYIIPSAYESKLWGGPVLNPCILFDPTPSAIYQATVYWVVCKLQSKYPIKLFFKPNSVSLTNSHIFK